MKNVLLFFSLFLLPFLGHAQTSTYKLGNTEYYSNRYYSTTGKPMVKRSEANKKSFLNNLGLTSVPFGMEVDHIIPLSQGGLDEAFNMQLLTKSAHAQKTARERKSSSGSVYRFNSGTGYSSKSSSSGSYAPPRTTYTGPRGGSYYYNSKGNKVYVKKN